MRRHRIKEELRDSLDGNGFRLVFQPKFTLSAQPRLAGAEVLLRWRHPELGEVSPAEFIPIAETTEVIVAVDRFVSSRLFAQIKAWRALGLDLPVIALNLSARSLREADFTAALVRDLDEAGVPHTLLQVEITEWALMEGSATVLRNLEVLHREGIKISIDDFGTGFSSFTYLKLMVVSELKIDKSFVDGLGRTREDEAIVTAILALGNALNLEMVAEGIETPQQLEWLRNSGCPTGQGYLFSRPLERSEFEDLVIGPLSGDLDNSTMRARCGNHVENRQSPPQPVRVRPFRYV